jgi:hypothetical protein
VTISLLGTTPLATGGLSIQRVQTPAHTTLEQTETKRDPLANATDDLTRLL